MSQTTLTAETQPVSALLAPRTVMLAVAMVSFSGLLLELAMTRLFSVVLFYHFAFFAISVALLGLGSGGVFAHIRRDWLMRFDLGTMGTLICILSSLTVPVVVWIVLHTPVSLQVTLANFGKLTVIYLATAVPFFSPDCCSPSYLPAPPAQSQSSMELILRAAQRHVWRWFRS